MTVEPYLGEIDALIGAHDYRALDRVAPALAAGQAPRRVAQRVALEAYWVARWTAPEVGLLAANAPDAYRLTMDHSEHYRHWTQRLAAATGYLGGPGPVEVAIAHCRELGLGDDDVRAYTPLPETIAMTCTMLFYLRRSYEEGLAVFGYARERVEEQGREGPAAALFRAVVTTRAVQDRCREAIRNFLLTAECRVRATNRWLA